MKRLLLLLALCLPAPAVAATGAGLYAESCLTCHGNLGQGVPNRGPSLQGVGALSADFYLRTGYMPLHSPSDQPVRRTRVFPPDQIDALVAYVAQLAKGPPVPTPHPERGNVARGLTLFTESCAGCHQVAAVGGFVTGARVPPLDRATPTQIAEAVRIGPYLMPSFSTKRISDGELDSIIAYVQYAKQPDDRGGWGIGHLGPVPEGLVVWLLAATVLVATCVLIGKRNKT